MHYILRVFLLPCFLFASINAFAIDFKPINAEFSTRGDEATRTFMVSNNSPSQASVSIAIAERHVDIDGNETLTSSNEDFLIYPTNIELKPHQEQLITITWLAKKASTLELAYRITVEENNTHIKLSGEFYVRPDLDMAFVETRNIDKRHAPILYMPPRSMDLEVENNGKSLTLIFDNRGTCHYILKDLSVYLKSSDGTVVILGANQLEGIEGETILANCQRRFVLPWPQVLPHGDIDVEFVSN
jgi:fimbrial chaperone protein